MKKLIATFATAALLSTAAMSAQSPAVQAEIDAFQKHFLDKFPALSLNDFAHGPYAMSEDKMMQFEAVMEMPPHEDLVDKGEKLWKTPFKNGKTYSSCFSGGDETLRTQFPHWSDEKGKFVTLEQSIVDCRVANGEGKIGTGKGKLAWMSAYLTTAAEGQTIQQMDELKKEAYKRYSAKLNEVKGVYGSFLQKQLELKLALYKALKEHNLLHNYLFQLQMERGY